MRSRLNEQVTANSEQVFAGRRHQQTERKQKMKLTKAEIANGVLIRKPNWKCIAKPAVEAA